MNLAMASHNTNNDHEGRLFDLLIQENRDMRKEFKDFTEKTDKTLGEILSQTQKTNGRVNKLDEAVFNKVDKSKLVPFYRDPKVLQITAYIVLAFLMLVAAVTGFDIGSLL